MSSTTLRSSLDLIEVKPGKKFSIAVLRDLLPDIETALFFAKVYELGAQELGTLLDEVFNTTLTNALFGEGALHSNELQDYLVGYEDDAGYWHDGVVGPHERGQVRFSTDKLPEGEILPHVWEDLEVTVAQSIKAVAEKLESVVAKLPGKEGSMMFSSMRVMNAKRPVIGDYKAQIHRERQQQNLLILDVSGSMTSETVRTIIDDVVALAYKANAHLAIVSDTCTYWEPGTFDSDVVLQHAEFSGTHYEKLHEVLDQDWGVVICVADYDSSHGAKAKLARSKGHIDTVLDVSLVNQPTFLAECVGQLADKVEPILIGRSNYPVGSHYDGMYG